ncbi:MAG TPA: NAD-dependent epimerase/dehydratase family protein [Gemmatimonadota bacterium]|nr:NAD-dependent epimerase/dehydratase family protein [Gemmatimonadota bacterium]
MSEKPERVLVTGGAGFIGSHVADRFLEAGCEVTVLDDLSTGKRENVPAAAHFVEMDLNDPDLADLFAESGFDLVDHHAAQIDVRVSVADPVRDARSNILGLLNLLECALASRVRRVVYISSGGVLYGEAERLPIPEASPLEPLSPYGVAKLAGELYLHYYAVVRGLAYGALRYGNVYGPRQSPHGEAGVVAIFGSRILAGEPITIFGDGEQERDYVYIADVVEANWLAATRPLPSPDGLESRGWNIGTGQGTSVNVLADRIMAIAGREVERRPAAERPGELRRSVLDPSRAAAALGWRPAHSLDQGLRKTIAWIDGERQAAPAAPAGPASAAPATPAAR